MQKQCCIQSSLQIKLISNLENKLGIVKMRAKLNEFGNDLLSVDKGLYDKFQAILQPDNSADQGQ